MSQKFGIYEKSGLLVVRNRTWDSSGLFICDTVLQQVPWHENSYFAPSCSRLLPVSLLSVEADFAVRLSPKLLRVIEMVITSFCRLTSHEDTDDH